MIPRPAKLPFTSSVAVAHQRDVSPGPVPEEVLSDPYITSAGGYEVCRFVVENVRPSGQTFILSEDEHDLISLSLERWTADLIPPDYVLDKSAG